MIAGAGFFVVATSVVGLLAYRVGAKRAHAAPAPTVSASAPHAPPIEIAAPPVIPNEPPPIAIVDEPNPPAGTPASSLRARPAWGRLDRGVRGSPTQQYAPQPTKPLEACLEATPVSGDLDRAFVTCRFQSFNKADTFAGDDLHVRATFGSTPEVAQDGPEDANLGFVSAPLVTMKKGAQMRFEVYDRDVFSMATLTKPVMTFAAQPIMMTDSGAAIECRQIAGAALTMAVTKYTAHADGVTGRYAHARLTGEGADWGWPTRDAREAERAIGDVAAFVGWDDARSKKRVAAFDAATANLEGQRPEVFAKLYAHASDSVSIGVVHAKLESVACGGHNGLAGACLVKVAITNGGDKPVTFGSIVGPQTYVATKKTGPKPVTLEKGALQTIDIAAKNSGTVTFAAPGTLDDEPSLLGVCVKPDILAQPRCGVMRTH